MYGVGDTRFYKLCSKDFIMSIKDCRLNFCKVNRQEQGNLSEFGSITLQKFNILGFVNGDNVFSCRFIFLLMKNK